MQLVGLIGKSLSRDILKKGDEERASDMILNNPRMFLNDVNNPNILKVSNYIRGLALLALGRYVEALEVFKKIKGNNEINTNSLFYQGICYIGIGSYDFAINVLEAFTNKNISEQDKQKAKFNIGYSLYMQEKWGQAKINFIESSVGPNKEVSNKSMLFYNICSGYIK